MRAFILSTFSLLLIAPPTIAETTTPTRLAVLDVESPDLTAVATLLEMELLKLPDTEALDRANLAAVLKEQQLQAALSADACRSRVALGKILKADVLVLLQMRAEPKSHGVLTAFETRSGLRLCVEGFLTTENAAQDAQSLVPQVKQALRRSRSAIREIVAVPPLVSNDLAPERQALGKPLANVIEQMLLDRPGMAVVELAEANALAREATIGGGERVTRKLPLYLLGEFRHDGYGPAAKITIELSLKRGTQLLGAQKIENAAPDKVAGLLRQTAAALLDKTTGGGPPAADVAIEAGQLTDRATLMFRLGACKECIELAEASLLLKSDQMEMHRIIVSATMDQIRAELAPIRHQTDEALARQGISKIYVRDYPLLASAQRARGPLVLRALAHMEIYLTQTQIRYSEEAWALIAGFFGFCGDHGAEFRQMVLRVLEAKKKANQVDDFLIFPVHCQQSCFENATDDEKWQWKLEVAERWPNTAMDANNLAQLQAVFLKYMDRVKHDDPQFLAALAKLKAIDQPAAKQVAANIQRRLDKGWDIYRDAPMFVPPKKTPPAPPENVEIRYVFSNVAGVNTGEIFGWIPTSPGIDALWSENRLYLLKNRKPLRQQDGILIKGAYDADVCYDGRYVWALRAALANGMPELLVIDPATSRIETITTDQGVPPIPLDDLSMTALREGSVCAVGHFNGRAWIGIASFDGAAGKKSLNVIHEAREVPTGDKSQAWKNISTAFGWSTAYTLTEVAARKGTRRQRVLVTRHNDLNPLLIDPANRSVEVFGPMRHLSGYLGGQVIT